MGRDDPQLHRERELGPAKSVTRREREAEVSEGPVLLQAVRATVTTIETRARIYRWAVVCVAMALVGPILLALAFLSWRPLPYVALLVPVVGAFLVIDSRTVLSWQRRVLHMWLSGDLGLSDLRQTVQAMRHVPAGTVAGMLDRLPPSEPPQQFDRLPTDSKASVAERCVARTSRQDRRTLLSTAGATLLVCSVAVTVSLQAATPLLVAPVGLLLIASSRRASVR